MGCAVAARTGKFPRSGRSAQRALRREHYRGFGPTLAAEHLARSGLVVSRETLRQWIERWRLNTIVPVEELPTFTMMDLGTAREH